MVRKGIENPKTGLIDLLVYFEVPLGQREVKNSLRMSY